MLSIWGVINNMLWPEHCIVFQFKSENLEEEVMWQRCVSGKNVRLFLSESRK